MVPASPGPPMTTILAGMAPTRPPGRAIPIAGARKTSTFVTGPLLHLIERYDIETPHKDHPLILMSQIRGFIYPLNRLRGHAVVSGDRRYYRAVLRLGRRLGVFQICEQPNFARGGDDLARDFYLFRW